MANYGYNPRFSVVDGAEASALGAEYMRNIKDVHEQVRTMLQSSRDIMKHYADQKRNESPAFDVGDEVLLSTAHLRLKRPARKLSERFAGPFKVVQRVSSTAYKLRLPADLQRIHPVFHVSLLQLVRKSAIPHRPQEPPPMLAIDGPEYEVANIVDSRIRQGQLQYRVQWAGYEGQTNEFTWEPVTGLADVQD